ncbi:MAG: hypothetical protein KDA84_13710, partial [Planctomycetaceae bacterium]|nr:hypothetical protein [Planctomycetaceae bacterium]
MSAREHLFVRNSTITMLSLGFWQQEEEKLGLGGGIFVRQGTGKIVSTIPANWYVANLREQYMLTLIVFEIRESTFVYPLVPLIRFWVGIEICQLALVTNAIPLSHNWGIDCILTRRDHYQVRHKSFHI